MSGARVRVVVSLEVVGTAEAGYTLEQLEQLEAELVATLEGAAAGALAAATVSVTYRGAS